MLPVSKYADITSVISAGGWTPKNLDPTLIGMHWWEERLIRDPKAKLSSTTAFPVVIEGSNSVRTAFVTVSNCFELIDGSDAVEDFTTVDHGGARMYTNAGRFGIEASDVVRVVNLTALPQVGAPIVITFRAPVDRIVQQSWNLSLLCNIFGGPAIFYSGLVSEKGFGVLEYVGEKTRYCKSINKKLVYASGTDKPLPMSVFREITVGLDHYKASSMGGLIICIVAVTRELGEVLYDVGKQASMKGQHRSAEEESDGAAKFTQLCEAEELDPDSIDIAEQIATETMELLDQASAITGKPVTAQLQPVIDGFKRAFVSKRWLTCYNSMTNLLNTYYSAEQALANAKPPGETAKPKSKRASEAVFGFGDEEIKPSGKVQAAVVARRTPSAPPPGRQTPAERAMREATYQQKLRTGRFNWKGQMLSRVPAQIAAATPAARPVASTEDIAKVRSRRKAAAVADLDEEEEENVVPTAVGQAPRKSNPRRENRGKAGKGSTGSF